MVVIRKISANAPIEDLASLLIDVVHNGSSVGFLAPLSQAVATQYWEQVLTDPSVHLWIAESEGQVVGSVQLAPCEKENGGHRAEVRKLIVHSAFRGQHIATKLMAALESFARSIGLHHRVLDTEVGSFGESVYRHLGWQKVGEIPDYATDPNGKLHGTAYYFKFTELS
jgi:acetyltransferase